MIRLESSSVVTHEAAASTDEDPLFIPHWYALYTRNRHEKVLDERLRMKGIETYLPLRRVSRRWSDRSKLIEDPLFKGYLFVRIPLISRWEVLNTAGAVRFVQFKPSQPAEIRERDIVSMRTFVNSELPVDPYPYIKEGSRAYIRSGPLKGVEGYVVRKDANCRIVLSVDSLMKSLSVKVDESCIEIL